MNLYRSIAASGQTRSNATAGSFFIAEEFLFRCLRVGSKMCVNSDCNRTGMMCREMS